jgi:hypothetical protein
MGSLERRYRRLLFTYPQEYRREHEDEITSTLLEASGPGTRWPSVRETAGLIVGGLRIRGLLATRRGGWAVSADGIRLAVVILLGLRLSVYTGLRFLPRPMLPPMPETQWIAALLTSLALVAVVRGATRSAVALIVIGGVASELPVGLFLRGQTGATPFSDAGALLALSAVLVVLQHRLDATRRPWSWWLAALVIGAPMLNAQAHWLFVAYLGYRVDAPYAPYVGWALSLLDELIAVAVPCALMVLALIGRDPRPSIAVAVTTAVSLIATLYAMLAFSLEWHAVLWMSFWQVTAQPLVVIAVSAITTAAILRTRPRLLRG